MTNKQRGTSMLYTAMFCMLFIVCNGFSQYWAAAITQSLVITTGFFAMAYLTVKGFQLLRKEG